MKGTLLNTATVATGATLGLTIGRFIPPGLQTVTIEGLGLVVALTGVKMFFRTQNAVVTVASIVIGGCLGALIGIPGALDAFAEWTRHTVGGSGHFNEGLITTSVLYCVGPMTLLGCLQDGLEGKIELLTLKSALDGVSAIFFAAALGSGVLVTALIVLIVQGAITLSARLVRRIATDEEFVAEFTAVGGAIILGIGLGLLNVKKMRMETYLPALLLAPVIVAAARKVRTKAPQTQ